MKVPGIEDLTPEEKNSANELSVYEKEEDGVIYNLYANNINTGFYYKEENRTHVFDLKGKYKHSN